MKNLIPILCILFCSSCSKEDSSLDNQINEPSYLLESIILNVDDEEFSGQYIQRYEYDDNNNPIYFYYYSSDDTNPIPKLKFYYNELNKLVEIRNAFEYYNDSNAPVFGYEKYSITTFNNQEAIASSSSFDANDMLIPNSFSGNLNVLFNNYLIKGLNYTSTIGYSVSADFEHDNQDRLTQITFSDNTNIVNPISISSWDDNLYPDNINPLCNYMSGFEYFFPKHYISSKNPTNYINAGITNSNSINYTYDANGNVSSHIINFYNSTDSNLFSKTYVLEN